jgi:hypothetical protein
VRSRSIARNGFLHHLSRLRIRVEPRVGDTENDGLIGDTCRLGRQPIRRCAADNHQDRKKQHRLDW